MSRYTYTIDENNAVSIFDTENVNENGKPNIFQPVNLVGGKPFSTNEEARAFAELIIDSLLNPELYAPIVYDPIVIETGMPEES
jgi:hypothetical protein